jgi:hypothetical protein
VLETSTVRLTFRAVTAGAAIVLHTVAVVARQVTASMAEQPQTAPAVLSIEIASAGHGRTGVAAAKMDSVVRMVFAGDLPAGRKFLHCSPRQAITD